MSLYHLTPLADSDLDQIWRYVLEHSGLARANTLETELHHAMQRLADTPSIGHLREDLAAEALRVWSVHKFLIIYRPATRPIQIVRVLHGARDVHAILARQPPMNNS